MSGYGQSQLPWLVSNGRAIGVKMRNGDEMMLPFFSTDGMSLTDIAGNPFTPATAPDVQKVAPASGATVQMTDTALNGTLLVAPAAALASLTVALPTEVNSRLGQIRRIATTKAISTLTVTGATILNTVGSLSAGDCVQFLKIDTNTWTRIV